MDSRIKLRPVTADDIGLLDQWDRQPHVIAATSDDPKADRAFEDADWSEQIDHIGPDHQIFIAEFDGRPIGALQIIDPHMEATHYWGDIERNLQAIDIWIGSPEDLGKGYGQTMMRRALSMCFEDKKVSGVLINPLASNARAHRFYRRLGFKPEGVREFDGDVCLIHRLTREEWQSRYPNDGAEFAAGSVSCH